MKNEIRLTIKLIRKGQPDLFLKADPIVNDCTDWEFTPDQQLAQSYSANRAVHIARYHNLRFPNGGQAVVCAR